MNLTHLNLILLGVGCGLLLIGFSARQYRWATAVMLIGIAFLLFMIGYDIHDLLDRP
jgi:uncharacterized membrane protein YccC